MDFQTSLFAAPESRVRDFARIERTPLTRGAWVDVLRTWLPDADDVFEILVRDVPWRAERRQMYDRVVDVPRLLHTYMIGDELPHPVLTDARDGTHRALRRTSSANLPHRRLRLLPRRSRLRRVARRHHRRGKTTDTMVAIVSLGDPRD